MIGLVFIVSACSGYGTRAYGSSAEGNSDLGPVLVDDNGLTVYVFANDGPGRSDCTQPCSDTWPPVPGQSLSAPTIGAERLNVISRPDGLVQTTLDNRPLYTFKDDNGPGDVNGHNVGDVWFAVSTDGEVLVPDGMRVGSTDAGDALIDPEDFTVYRFAQDQPGVSNCDAVCAENWRPVGGNLRLDVGLDPTQFGQIARDDGAPQLTFLDSPLYTYLGDANPGDANGTLVGEDGTWTTVGLDELRTIEATGPFGSLVEAATIDDETVPERENAPTTPYGPSTDQAVDEAPEMDDAEAPAPTDAAAYGISVATTELGEVLVSGSGLTLYAFTDDTASESTCLDTCAAAWPPLPGDALVERSIVGLDTRSIARADGTEQLVIGQWPVYLFAGDVNPGDVNGHGSGNVWFAIAPDGSLVR